MMQLKKSALKKLIEQLNPLFGKMCLTLAGRVVFTATCSFWVRRKISYNCCAPARKDSPSLIYLNSAGDVNISHILIEWPFPWWKIMICKMQTSRTYIWQGICFCRIIYQQNAMCLSFTFASTQLWICTLKVTRNVKMVIKIYVFGLSWCTNKRWSPYAYSLEPKRKCGYQTRINSYTKNRRWISMFIAPFLADHLLFDILCLHLPEDLRVWSHVE